MHVDEFEFGIVFIEMIEKWYVIIKMNMKEIIFDQAHLIWMLVIEYEEYILEILIQIFSYVDEVILMV